jgi:hypothetical protein
MCENKDCSECPNPNCDGRDYLPLPNTMEQIVNEAKSLTKVSRDDHKDYPTMEPTGSIKAAFPDYAQTMEPTDALVPPTVIETGQGTQEQYQPISLGGGTGGFKARFPEDREWLEKRERQHLSSYPML